MDVAGILEIAEKFALGGCCGKRSVVSLKDIARLGLLPIPRIYESSFGLIVPLFGWKELCVWVHEEMFGSFPHDWSSDPGEAVAEMLRKIAKNKRE